MSKKQDDDLASDMTIADILLRLKTLENLLISKKVFTLDEFIQEMNEISSKVAKAILQKANIPGDLDELIKNLQNDSKKDSNN